MRFLFKLLSRLSLESLYRIVARPFFDWGYYILRWRRTLAANNLAHSFPELTADRIATSLTSLPKSSGASARRARNCAIAFTSSIPKWCSSARVRDSRSC